jgi:hypothetical protein
MKNQILSLAIALPTVLISALPSLANTERIISNKVNILQPILFSPELQVPEASNELGNPADYINAPGPNGVQPRPGRGPRPPRKETDIRFQPVLNINPVLNSSPANLNINNVAPGY